MKIKIDKLTDFWLLKDAVDFVFGTNIGTTYGSVERWYEAEHSPLRTQLFAIYAYDTPYSVCMQMRTHEKNGALFLIEPGRPDTGTERAKQQEGDYRERPRNMFTLCNAQHLIDWSHKRLCAKAEDTTRRWFELLKSEMERRDPLLARRMEPMCEYRGGICGEFKPCGKGKRRTYGAQEW